MQSVVRLRALLVATATAAVIVTSGCGRVAFDDLPADALARVCDVAVGHDEDADGIDDACDGCPHLADAAQPDGDGDGVNDGCDPNPASPTESIAFFDPFTTKSDAWQFVNIMPTSDGDELVANTLPGTLVMRRNIVPMRETLILGGYAGEGDTAQDSQILLSNGNVDGAGFYCELEGPNTMTKIAATYTRGDMMFTVTDSSYGPGLRNAEFELTFSFTAPELTCSTTWAVDRPIVKGTIPGDIVPTRMNIQVQNIEIRLHYFLHIHTE